MAGGRLGAIGGGWGALGGALGHIGPQRVGRGTLGAGRHWQPLLIDVADACAHAGFAGWVAVSVGRERYRDTERARIDPTALLELHLIARHPLSPRRRRRLLPTPYLSFRLSAGRDRKQCPLIVVTFCPRISPHPHKGGRWPSPRPTLTLADTPSCADLVRRSLGCSAFSSEFLLPPQVRWPDFLLVPRATGTALPATTLTPCMDFRDR